MLCYVVVAVADESIASSTAVVGVVAVAVAVAAFLVIWLTPPPNGNALSAGVQRGLGVRQGHPHREGLRSAPDRQACRAGAGGWVATILHYCAALISSGRRRTSFGGRERIYGVGLTGLHTTIDLNRSLL